MVKIGKKYGVSDNTIRDWINKYKNEKELKDIVIDINREKIPTAPVAE